MAKTACELQQLRIKGFGTGCAGRGSISCLFTAKVFLVGWHEQAELDPAQHPGEVLSHELHIQKVLPCVGGHHLANGLGPNLSERKFR